MPKYEFVLEDGTTKIEGLVYFKCAFYSNYPEQLPHILDKPHKRLVYIHHNSRYHTKYTGTDVYNYGYVSKLALKQGYVNTPDNKAFAFCKKCFRWFYHKNYNYKTYMCAYCSQGAYTFPTEQSSNIDGVLQDSSANVLHYTKPFRALDIEKDPLYMGYELELGRINPYEQGTISEAIKLLYYKYSDYLIVKKDESISGGGAEIVSTPSSLMFHKSILKKVLNTVDPYLEYNPSCGFHVHIDRRYLTHIQQYKLNLFMSTAPEAWLNKLAGRYTYWAHRNYIPPIPQKLKCIKDVHSTKYKQMNIHNINTMEFRLFKSSTNYDELAKNLEFVDSVTKWVIQCPLKYINVDKYLLWLYKQPPKLYGTLIDFFKNKHESVDPLDVDTLTEELEYNLSYED